MTSSSSGSAASAANGSSPSAAQSAAPERNRSPPVPSPASTVSSPSPRITGTSPVAGSLQCGSPSGAGGVTSTADVGSGSSIGPRSGSPRSRASAVAPPVAAAISSTSPGCSAVGSSLAPEVPVPESGKLASVRFDGSGRAGTSPNRGSDSPRRCAAAPASMTAWASSAPMIRTPSPLTGGATAGRSGMSVSSS